ncbi:PH domain-containing protein [Paenibacillus thailandensis]|uniref:PH domain-containing protein n=1 Tax=Paenibacillus thailandensis TaxID=393250 RepID=A0ABW5R0H2_9BACL
MARFEHAAASAEKRLHPVSMLYFLVRSGKETAGLLPLIPVCILLADRIFGKEVDRFLLTALVIAGAAILLIAFAWLRWRRFQYRIEPNVLYIEHGLWVRQKAWISKDRILSLDTSVSVYDRLFGLVRLEVETAGGDDKPEAVLSSITAAEAARIQEELGWSRRAAAAAPSAGETSRLDEPDSGVPSRLQLPLGRTLLLSATSGKFGVVWLVIAGGGLKLWDQWLRESAIWAYLYDRLTAVNFAGIVVAYAIVTWLLAFAVTFLFVYGFRLELEEGRLTIERGLAEKKRKVIATRRIQAVRVTENALQRLFGMASVRIVVAGSSDEDKKTVDLYPLVRVSELPALFETFLPDYRLPKTWNPVSRKAYGHYVTVPALLGLLAAGAAIVWLPTGWRWCAILLPVIVWRTGAMEFRQAAWSLEEGQLGIRSGSFSKQIALIPRFRVQWHRTSQSPLEEGKRLATLKVAVASGKSGARFSLRHAPASDIRKLSSWLSGSEKRTEL